MNLALINPKVWLELIVLALVGALFWWVYQCGADSVQKKWDAEKLEIANQTIKIKDEAKAKTDKLQSEFTAISRQKDEQISALNRNLAASIAGLSNRPARDSQGSVPVDPVSGAKLGATGADLLRQDSEFLTRESARADRIRLQLVDCQAKYNKAADAVN